MKNLPKIFIETSDITTQKVDAIVNAANASLLGGGGVDGAIHRAAGPKLLQACRKLRQTTHVDGLPTGHAAATTAGNLAAHYVIHTVGPIYSNCQPNCQELLAACYTNALQLAVELGCKSIAFPFISTGIYGYPKEEAARIAYESVEKFLDMGVEIKVHFIFHSQNNEEIFKRANHLP